MPLIKSTSKKAFKKNLKTELKSGRSKKQALALAYSMFRRAARKARKRKKKA